MSALANRFNKLYDHAQESGCELVLIYAIFANKLWSPVILPGIFNARQ